jgi:hypothetical protein
MNLSEFMHGYEAKITKKNNSFKPQFSMHLDEVSM